MFPSPDTSQPPLSALIGHETLRLTLLRKSDCVFNIQHCGGNKVSALPNTWGENVLSIHNCLEHARLYRNVGTAMIMALIRGYPGSTAFTLKGLRH